MFARFTALALAAFVLAAQAIPAPEPICDCPFGSRLVSTEPAIQCAYPHGACTWDEKGILLDKAQSNCEQRIIPGACPKDLTGAKGTLINHLFKFTCEFLGPHDFGECTWDADGDVVRPPSAGFCAAQVTPCVHN